MKKFFSEFKKFISRGNVLDLAVGVIIGGAFTAIVTALTDGILKPLINFIISLISGGNDASAFYSFLKTVYVVAEDGTPTTTIDMASSIYIDWGALISAIINFFLIAFVLFIIIKAINKAKELTDLDAATQKIIEKKVADGKKLTKKEAKYYEKMQEAKRAEEEAAAKAAEEAAKLTTTEKLLIDIKTLLENK